MRLFFPFAVALVLSAAPLHAGERPPKPATQTDPACTWVWKSGGGVGLWTEACKLKTGDWGVDWNASEKRFELKVDATVTSTVVQVFKKDPDAPISSLLPELKARGFIADDKECEFQPLEDGGIDAAGRQLYDIQPTGRRLEAFNATPKDEVPEPPCGDYAWSTHGTRTFRIDAKHPDAVIYVDEGQDGTMIAPATITFE